MPAPASKPVRSTSDDHAERTPGPSRRAGALRASGIRRVLARAATMPHAVNLTIGQPDFPVPDAVRRATIEAIESGRNGYSANAGDPVLVERINRFLALDLGWACRAPGTPGHAGPSTLVTTGTSGALTLAFLSLLDPGDSCVIPDPYFVSYPELASMCHATAVLCETGADGEMTAERVEPLLDERTRFVLFNTPSNPAGVVASKRTCADLLDLCRSRGVVLISDEIYDAFAFPAARTDACVRDATMKRCPSPARLPGAEESVLLVRGFGKTYGCTGWRLGYASGPGWLIDAMTRFHQYTFVCAPTPLQFGAAACFDVDMDPVVLDYERRRDMILDRLGGLTDIVPPAGAFYAWVRVPERLGMSATAFCDLAAERGVLVVPGAVFSAKDTHFRISYATDPARLAEGLDLLAALLAGA